MNSQESCPAPWGEFDRQRAELLQELIREKDKQIELLERQLSDKK